MTTTWIDGLGWFPFYKHAQISYVNGIPETGSLGLLSGAGLMALVVPRKSLRAA